MPADIETRAQRYAKLHKRRRLWVALMLLLGCAVALSTVVALTWHAETAGQQAYCGLEEHQHTDACYERRLVCGYDEDATTPHVHTDACYTAETHLVCGYGDEATTPHVHTDACYTDQPVLVCGQEEGVDGHEHTDACYATEPVLTCGIDEGAVEHTHTDACYATESVLTCGIAEGSVEHMHTGACYERVLTCELPEHTHTLACYSNPDADVEDSATWQASTSAAQLTGAWGHDAAAVARTQLGYAENTLNYQVAEDGTTTKGYTRYGAWAGSPYEDWSTPFVSFCLAYAGVPQDAMPRPTDAATVPQTFADAGLWREALAYTPAEGDLVLLDQDADGTCDHVGVVSDVDDEAGSLRCVVGDLDDAVRSASYALGGGSPEVMAYVEMPANPSLTPADDADEPAAGDAEEPAAQDAPATEAAGSEAETAGNADGEADAAGSAESDGEAASSAADEPVADESAAADAGETPAASASEPAADADGEVATARAASASVDAASSATAGAGAPATQAATRASDGNASEIHVGESLDLTVTAGTTVELAFVAPYTHEYVFYSTGTGDTYGHLYDATGKELAKNDDGAGNGQFKVTYTLTAGQTYYFGARYYSSSTSGTIPVTLELSSHNYQPTDDGSYRCDACGTVLSTVEGTFGNGFTWKMQGGTLTISGTGAMPGYSGSQKVPWEAFKGYITSVVIDEGVTSVGSNALRNCPLLASASLPTSLASIGDYAFYDCGSLASIELPEGLTSIGTGALYGCAALPSVTLPQGLTTLGDYAFDNCSSLTSVVVPDGITSIGASTFFGCAALTSVTLPQGITSIRGYAFGNCRSLASIDLPQGLTSLGGYAFSGCSKLSSIELPKGLTSLGDGAFRYCRSLGSIELPEGITSIGADTFEGCNALTSMVLPEGVTSIGYQAFYACENLASVTFPESLTSIGNSAFSRCALDSLELPDGLTSIGTFAFYRCSSLSSAILPRGLTSVGQDAFDSCTSLTNVRWDVAAPVSMSRLGKAGSFVLTLGKDVDELSAQNFAALIASGCSGLVFEGPNYLKLPALEASFLTAPLTTLPEAEYFVDEQGLTLYRINPETNTATLAYCAPGVTSLTIPAQLPARTDGGEAVKVVGVDPYALNCAKDLESLAFEAPSQVTTLADFAFANARRLSSVNGCGTDAEVLATMPGAHVGEQVFYNTLISHVNSGQTSEALRASKDGVELTISAGTSSLHSPKLSEDGTFLYYTGESTPITISVSNPQSSAVSEGSVVRAYLAFDSEDGRIDYALGKHVVRVESGNTYTVTVSKTSVPGCYCFEVERPKQGDTVAISVGATYPSPTTPGGGAMVWGSVLTADEAAALGTGLLPMTSYQAVSWETKPDTFPVTKSLISSPAPTLVGDGLGDAYIHNLSYRITMARAGSTQEGVGKDYMTTADFADVLTLPDGASLNDEVVTAIREGRVKAQNAYGKVTVSIEDSQAGTKRDILTLSFSSNDVVTSSVRLEVNDEGKLVVHWTWANTNRATEIADITVTCSVLDNVLSVKAPQAGQTYTVVNDVSCTQHFMYSADQVQQASCPADVTTVNGSLVLDKKEPGSSRTFGSPASFVITARNPGTLPYEGLAKLVDAMPNILHMRAEDIAAAFADDPEHQLTITIANASLCTAGAGRTVTALDGSSQVTVVRQNEGSDSHYSGLSSTDADRAEFATLTIGWKDDGQLSVKKGGAEVASCSPTAEGVQAVLDSLGYVVVPDTMFTLEWDLRVDGKAPALAGGATVTKTVPCANKDTFMYLSADRRNKYGNTTFFQSNYARAYDGDGKFLASTYIMHWVEPEFSLSKSYSSDGSALLPSTHLEQGSVLDYSLNVSHTGRGSYEALPLVDRMSGAQALLVPADLNAGAAWAQGCATVEEDGAQWYVLATPGTYEGVWTAQGQMADTVTVTAASSGLDTLIKWYFADYTGVRSDTVGYRAYVCPSDVVPGQLTFSLSNETWLNDHESHRLYDTVFWEGATVGFDKKIVEAVGDMGVGTVHSVVHEDETVVYRLELDGEDDSDGNPVPMTITGSQMYDALPSSIASWRWSSDNVTVSYGDGCEVTNGDHWSVTDADANDQQLLKWADDVSLTVTGRACIYVTLKYPSGTAWQEYASAYASSELVNTYHVLSGQASVTHELGIAGSARLQKGVKFSGRHSGSNDITNGLYDSRFYYSNTDAVAGTYVQYYVTLYNGGLINLYLTDMQDVLPRGFTFWGCDKWNYSTGATDTSKHDSTSGTVLRDDGAEAAYMRASYSVSSTTTEDGRNRLTIHFGGSPDDTQSAVAYDAARGMYYLRPGEAIAFSYSCLTNETAGSDDVATNTVSMPYYDWNGAGVTIDESSSTVAPDTDKYAPNDGGCSLWGNEQAQAAGLVGGSSGTQWLESDVTVTRGAIKPGITKALTSKTSETGVVEDNPVTVKSSDVLNWTATAENDGALPLADYVLTDVVPQPYMFCGSIGYQTYYGSTAGTPVSAGRPSGDAPLMTMTAGTDEDTLVLTGAGSNKQYTLTIGGPAVDVPCSWTRLTSSGGTHETTTVTVSVRVARDADGNAQLSLRFGDGRMAIPDGGSGVLTYSTRNESGVLENRQFVNACFITPLAQQWDGTASKGNVTQLETPFATGAKPTVRNSTPFTTAFGYTTSSVKSVEEVGAPGNAAASTDERNYIALSSADSLFRYTASVTNGSDKAMRKMVIIDNLPQVGDHTSFAADDPRYSEFEVALAAEPAFEVVVTRTDGSTATLDASQYRVEFSTSTEFSAADWKGSDTGTWDADASGARSLRLVIEDDAADADVIPAGATVSLRFTCKVSGQAEPGSLAWNSFGYHYGLKGVTSELEAAPLKVGVMVPTIPNIQKKVVDHAGTPRAAEQDATFSFVAYEGEPLSGTFASESELAAALDARGSAHHTFTVTVKAGQTSSDPVPMAADGWTWKSGQRYTVAELPCGDDYALRRFEGFSGSAATFAYDPATSRTVVCQNYAQRWGVALTKTDAAGSALAGAVFALYSPDARDALASVPDAYANLGVATELARDGKVWYLAGMGESDAGGALSWGNLLRASYYLLEVKAPDGYILPATPGKVLEQAREEQGQVSLTVVNRQGPRLPETGGPGTLLTSLGGAGLVIAALLLHVRARRGREGRQSG